MLNGIWGFFLIGGILTGAFLGRMDMVTGAILSGGRFFQRSGAWLLGDGTRGFQRKRAGATGDVGHF